MVALANEIYALYQQ